MEYPDIYFTEFWGRLNAPLAGGVYERFAYENDFGIGYYHFVKRAVPFLIGSIQYFDIVTPYGFNGPIILKCDEQKRALFVKDFDEAFQKYCNEAGIIAEYVRFNPWLKNHVDFSQVYQLKYHNYTLATSLKDEYFNNEFSSKARNQIRKAIKNGVEIEYDFYGNENTIKNFYRLYELMAQKNNISDTYRFTQQYINDLVKSCKGHIFFLNGILNGSIISSAIFLHFNSYVHYHLSANDNLYKGACANHLILNSAAQWGKENHKDTLHLGGAFSDSLYHFKKAFTHNGVYDYYTGSKIRNTSVYEKAIKKSGLQRKDFFPGYRK